MSIYAIVEIMKHVLVLFSMLLSPALAFAHDDTADASFFSSQVTHTFMWQVLLCAVVLLALLFLLSLLYAKKSNAVKRLLFWSMTAVILATTTTLIGTTIMTNATSWSKGPVHWHADFQVWACGREVNLKDPKGLSNKIGTSVLHEHNDNRIHYEGVVIQERDATLGAFFHALGGELTQNSLTLPTNDGMVTYKNSDECRQYEPAKLQVFTYQVNTDGTFTQTKLADPANYLLRPQSQVPPGDCIIFEFTSDKDRTNHLCQSFSVAMKTGKLKGESNDRN